ncbi:MAG: metallophosphoesterase [Pseudothermotoga sp.]
MQRFILFFILICVVFSSGLAFKIVLTSDVHERLNEKGWGPAGLIEWFATVDRKDLLLMDAGDLFDSKLQLPFFGDNRQQVMDYIKTVKYDAMVLGNHEYYFSREWFEFYKKFNDSLVGANVDGLNPYRLFEIDGTKIAVIGLTTVQHLANRVEHYGNLPRDPFESLKKTLGNLPEVDYVICLNHVPHVHDKKILETFPEVDLVLSGHDHMGPRLEKIGNGYLFEAGSGANSVYLIEVDPFEKAVTYEQLKVSTDYKVQSNAVQMAVLIGTILGILSLAWILF